MPWLRSLSLRENHDARFLTRSKIRFTGTNQRIRHSADHRRVGQVIGREASIGTVALQKALNLLIPDHFEHLIIDDEIISDVLIKSILLRRMTKDRLVKFVMEQIKPFMGAQDILQVQLDLEILHTGEVE